MALIQGRERAIPNGHGSQLSLAPALVPALLSSGRSLRSARDRCRRRDRGRPRTARDRMVARASGPAWPVGRARALRRSHAVARRRQQVGHASGLHALEARVPRDRRLTKRRILKDVGPLRFGEGHATTFPYALALAAGAEYDWLMGSSGAAFTTTIDEAGWDPLAAAPRDAETLARAARAAGVRLDPEPPPYDEEMQALILDRAKEAIDAHLPPLVFGLGGAPADGLIVGYGGEGPALFARTFFDKGDDPRRAGWSEFESEDRGGLIFLDKGVAPDRTHSAQG